MKDKLKIEEKNLILKDSCTKINCWFLTKLKKTVTPVSLWVSEGQTSSLLKTWRSNNWVKCMNCGCLDGRHQILMSDPGTTNTQIPSCHHDQPTSLPNTPRYQIHSDPCRWFSLRGGGEYESKWLWSRKKNRYYSSVATSQSLVNRIKYIQKCAEDFPPGGGGGAGTF